MFDQPPSRPVRRMHHALQDIPPALDLHEQLLELGTPLQMANAMKEALARMNSGHVFRGEDAAL